MPRDVLSGGLGLDDLGGGCECVKRLDELSRLSSEEMRFELSKLDAGEIEVEVVGTSMGRLEPVTLVWESGQS